MNEKLREHIEKLFKNAPQTRQAVEIKEEILQNTIDRYNDLKAEGKSDEAAYNIAIAGIGDVDHLIVKSHFRDQMHILSGKGNLVTDW